MVWQDALHEEADNTILVHVKDMMVQNDCKSIQTITVDTDVVIIMLAFMPHLKFHDGGVEELIDFGIGDHRRMISLNRSFESLGYSFTKALLFFYAFTYCDSTSSFFGKTKSFWFNQLHSYPRTEEVTKAFGSLSCTPLLAAVQDNMAEIELFVNHCYGQTDVLSVNGARFQIVTSSVSGNLSYLPQEAA